MPKVPVEAADPALGYQSFSYYRRGENPHGVHLDDPAALRHMLTRTEEAGKDLYLYTQHEVFWDDKPGAVLQQTRSGPNWDGGVVTIATCKHHTRTTNRVWEGTWIAGLGPARCAGNCLLYVARVGVALDSNYHLGLTVQSIDRQAWAAKQADANPRGDLYRPDLAGLRAFGPYDHRAYHEPPGHTRSTEFYKKSPGSVSERPDGKVPKWWRDVEYIGRGRRPPVFLFDRVALFSRPMLWVRYRPGRACLRLSPSELRDGLLTHSA